MSRLSRSDTLVPLFLLAVMALTPVALRSQTAISLACLAGCLSVAILSNTILLGQTGLLSFGQALYLGLGAFGAAHATRFAAAMGWDSFMLPLVPLAGGGLSLVAALLVGWLNVRRAGVVFAMITLGIAEMVHAYALMDNGFFGGDQGVTFDRVLARSLMGVSFGPQVQVYGLILFWVLAMLLLVSRFRASVLGDLARAVRDNEARVSFLGFDASVIRYGSFCLAAFVSGVAGSLYALNFEVVTAQILSLEQSSTILVAGYIGGAASLAGAVVGAVVYVLFASVLSTVTQAWPFHLGMMFVVCVLFMPHGIVGFLREAPVLIRARLAENGMRSVLLDGLRGVAALITYVLVVEAIYMIARGTSLPAALLWLIGVFSVTLGAFWFLARRITTSRQHLEEGLNA